MEASVKHQAWKYLGAMFMESKNGIQAVSFTRVLGLICFGYLSYQWLGAVEVPETLLYTFWGLIGGKTMESMVALWKGKKGT